jgi:hypothetical protein
LPGQRLRFAVELTEPQSGLRIRSSPCGIDAHAFHPGEVNQHSTVASGFPRNTVAAPTHRDPNIPGEREVDAPHHVANSLATNDHSGCLSIIALNTRRVVGVAVDATTAYCDYVYGRFALPADHSERY